MSEAEEAPAVDVEALLTRVRELAADQIDRGLPVGTSLARAWCELDAALSGGLTPEDYRGSWYYCPDCGAFYEDRHREDCSEYDEAADGAWGEGVLKDGEAEFLGRQHAAGLHDGGPGRPPSDRCFACTHPIPADFPVRPIESSEAIAAAGALATCGVCHRSWDDAVSTALTPVPAARCPFEYHHPEESA